MRAEANTIDSEAAGCNVIDIHDFDDRMDFASFETAAVLPLAPHLAFCKVPAENVLPIHRLEDLGFRFAELQLSITARMKRRFDTESFRYTFMPVESEEDAAAALALAGSIFTHDRFTTDELLGRAASRRRYESYLRRSLARPDERVYVMKNDATGAVVSFASIRLLGPTEARLLIGGVANEFKKSGLGVIHDYVGWNAYYDQGIRTLRSAVSAANHPIINLEISHLGFRVDGSHLVLRKSYRGSLP
jgi:hypothetical protein